MKNPLLMTTLAVGFLAGLGIAAVRGDFSRPAAAPVDAPTEQVAVMPPQPVVVRPVTMAPGTDIALPASDAQPDGGDSADTLPAPTYDQETAARDRAAAHSARSR
jgi:hypothetical protein